MVEIQSIIANFGTSIFFIIFALLWLKIPWLKMNLLVYKFYKSITCLFSHLLRCKLYAVILILYALKIDPHWGKSSFYLVNKKQFFERDETHKLKHLKINFNLISVQLTAAAPALSKVRKKVSIFFFQKWGKIDVNFMFSLAEWRNSISFKTLHLE